MILADTSVWIDHLRGRERAFASALVRGSILTHPYIIGEIALGHLHARKRILQSLHDLPLAAVATDDEVLRLIEQEKLFGRGVGYVDAHLLAAARLSGNVSLWTRDRLLRETAQHLGLAYEER